MPFSADWPNEQTALAISAEDLGVAILFELAERGDAMLLNRNNFINRAVDGEDGWRPGGMPIVGPIYSGADNRAERDHLKETVGAAFDYIRNEGYLTHDPSQRGTDWVKLTQKGKDLVARPRPDALAMSRAVSALNHPLHPRLVAASVDTSFRAGRLDHAIRDAFRDIEYVVRTMSQSTQTSPVKLMEEAFDPAAGPLTDPNASQPKKNAQQRLFMGAFGVYRNDPNHTYVPYDPDEAIEIVIFASLLTRRLEDVARRLGVVLTQV